MNFIGYASNSKLSEWCINNERVSRNSPKTHHTQSKKIYFLQKKYTFKNFLESQKFINEIGKISENEGHHPDISFGWGYAEIKITTHAIEGLSENDFILAAKIDQIINV